MKIFKLADLGEGLPEAEIQVWHIQEGDFVEADAPLVAVETAKAVVEVPSPYSGVVKKLYAKVGELVATNAPLVGFAVSDNNSTTVAGQIEESDEVRDEAIAVATKAASAANALRATPAVRALAKRMGVDLNLVTPTGPNNTIIARDVKEFSVQQDHQPTGNLTATLRAMNDLMSKSQRAVVPATLMDDANITHSQDMDISVRLMRAITKGLIAEPALNAWFDLKTLNFEPKSSINLGLAVDTQEGLFMPVIHDMASLSAAELRSELNLLKQQVLKRSIPPQKLQGATFILSNVGTIAGKYAQPVVVPPSVAILASGRITESLILENATPRMQKILPLSLSFNHRVITGGQAARFLKAVIADLELAQ